MLNEYGTATMKVGIMTYWQTVDNYGQLLQCYALQQTLKEMGCEPYVIRYDIYNRKRTVSFARRMAHVLLFPVYLKKLKKRREALQAKHQLEERRHFEDFRARHFRFSSNLYVSLKALQKNPPPADCYIAGSDQIWGQLLSEPENEAFYLNFGDRGTRRISFAASFGMEKYPSALNNKLRQNLLRFNQVSCRENAGVRICADVGINAERIIDPTLLVKKDIYEVLISPRITEKDYVFVYSINVRETKDIRYSELEQHSRKHNWQTIVTIGSGYIKGKEIYDNVTYSYATIEQWLSNIKNASLIVTPSFHGIAFCIIFHRPFVYVPLTGNMSKGNNRVLELLDELGLAEHVLSKSKGYEELAAIPYDWNIVDERLQKLRNDAQLFMLRALPI